MDLKIVKGIKGGICFRDVNGNKNPGEDLIKQYNLDSLNIIKWKEHHYCHFGGLMELKVSGLILDDKVMVSKFQGKDCYAIRFVHGSDSVSNPYFKNTEWTLFIDPATFSVTGGIYRRIFGMDGYVLFSGSLNVNGIRMPLMRTYYNVTDSSFLAVDVFSYID